MTASTTMKNTNHTSISTVLQYTQRVFKHPLSLYFTPISAGFPSPADDFIEHNLDLNELLIEHPSSTFFVRVVGDSMTDSGIHAGDRLIVDRARDPASGSIVIAVVDDELQVKQLRKGESVEIWGVVTTVIRQV